MISPPPVMAVGVCVSILPGILPMPGAQSSASPARHPPKVARTISRWRRFHSRRALSACWRRFQLFHRRVRRPATIYTVIAGTVFWALRLYAFVWRYASVEDLLAIIKAVSIICLVYFAAMFLVSRLELIPRSALPINWLVLLALLGGPRFVYRLFKDRRAHDAGERDGERRIPVLLIGAGDSAELFIRAINRPKQSREIGADAGSVYERHPNRDAGEAGLFGNFLKCGLGR